MGSTHLTLGSFLRITSISVAIYECVKQSLCSRCSDIIPPPFVLTYTPQLSGNHPCGMENIPFKRVDAVWVQTSRPSLTGDPLLTPSHRQFFSQQDFVHLDTVFIKHYLRRVGIFLTLAYCIRYVSIILLVISNLGFYHHGFSAATCSRYYIVPPVLKGKCFSRFKQLVFTHVLHRQWFRS